MIAKKIVLLICLFIITASIAIAEEQYDPQFTLQALNIAIVSIQKIISSENKVVLTQEYDNIINNLKTGNIEPDDEITSLYEKLMKVISSKTIRKEEKERLKAQYDKKEKRQVIEALSGIKADGGDWKSGLISLLTSCVSQYFSYKNAKEELKDRLDDDLWQLKKEELTDINEMRQKLLTSSWNLLRKYKISDENKLTEKTLDNYYKGITNSNVDARLRIIKRQERYFQAYPPYWIDRANAANAASNNEEVKKCYDKFDEVWRPVLRKDVYKSTALKYHLKEELSKKSDADKTKIKEYLEELRKYSEDDDWVTNIMIGLGYFQIGEKDKAIDNVLANVDSEYETEISKILVEKIKAGKLDDFDFSKVGLDELKKEKNVSNEIKKCLNCENGYTERIFEYKICPTCNGKKVISPLYLKPSISPFTFTITEMIVDKIIDKTCSKTCKKCNGTGIITSIKRIRCEKCNGSGKEK
jgi:hypothetical protein